MPYLYKNLHPTEFLHRTSILSHGALHYITRDRVSKEIALCKYGQVSDKNDVHQIYSFFNFLQN